MAESGEGLAFLWILSFRKISVASRRWVLSTILVQVSGYSRVRGEVVNRVLLLDVPREERQVEYQRDPVAVDKEEEGQEAVDGSFGDDVRVEPVAEIDGVDVVTVYRRSIG